MVVRLCSCFEWVLRIGGGGSSGGYTRSVDAASPEPENEEEEEPG